MNIHTFCCTGPDLATGGRYPLCCPVVSGLSYLRRSGDQQAVFLVEGKDTKLQVDCEIWDKVSWGKKGY